MVVYYAQILNRRSKKILCGDYTAAGQPLREDNSILLELKQVIATLPETSVQNKMYSVHSKNGKYTFYFQITKQLLMCILADKNEIGARISSYFNSLSTSFTEKYSNLEAPHYEFEGKLRSICNEKNKTAKLDQGVKELDGVHTVLLENLDSLVNRGENINSLRELADKVNLETRELSRRANEIKMRAKMDKYKVYGVFLLFLFFILYLFFR